MSVAAQPCSEGSYRTLFETADEGLCLIDVTVDASGRHAAHYRLVETNAAFARHTGLDAAHGRAVRMPAGGDPRWLDTCGRNEGTMCVRWIRSQTFPDPQTRVVKLDSLS